MPLTSDERQALRRRCSTFVQGFHAPSPAEDFEQLAAWCRTHDVTYDHYGKGRLVEDFETKVAHVLGLPAATFVPSGVMAQLAAMRLWCQRARLPRFGLHPTSHLLLHEEQAWEALLQLHAVPLGDRLRPLLAADLTAAAQPLACVLVELPIREAGGQLPSWDELQALKEAASSRAVTLHMDGARLWESGPFYGRAYADICAGFGSVYVSLYKGIGAPAGAMLAGDEAFVAEARLWRRRMGGTLYRMSPMVAAAAMRFDERLALMQPLHERAKWLASLLSRHGGLLRANPAVPHTNMLHLSIAATPAAALEARDAAAEGTGCWLFESARATEVPGFSLTEISVGDRLLQADDAAVARGIEAFCEALERPAPA